MTDERERWQQMVIDLNQLFSLQFIANEVRVSVRQVSNWKAGSDRPIGMNAVRLYMFHLKHVGDTLVDLQQVPRGE